MKELILETEKSKELEFGGVGIGTKYHDKLKHRDMEDQHPISAITGLEEELKGKQPAGNYVRADDLKNREAYPVATTEDKGVIKVGYNLAVTPEGMLYLPLSTEEKADAAETGYLTIGDKSYKLLDAEARENAQQALEKSAEAQAAAQTAQTAATAAQTAAQRAEAAAQQAEQTAQSQQQSIQAAQTTADTALQKAEAAQQSADNAQSTADTALQKANAAQQSADNAQSTADTAAEKADNAQDTADDALVLIAKLREDFEYKPIAVSSVSCNAQSVQELGTQLSGVVINWSVNKTPASQSVNGTQVAAQEGVTSYSYTDPASYKPTEVTTKKWTVTATDERGAAATGSTAVTFCNGIYTGVVQGSSQPSRDTLLALTKKLQNSKALTFTATADAGWHLICALPSRLDTPAFKDKDTGFEAGFTKMYASVSFENGSGYTENYDIWLSNKSGLGTITVAVT